MKIKFDDNLLGCADGLKIGYALIENLRIIKTSKEFDIELNSLVETIRKSYKNPAILYEDYRIEGIRLFLKRKGIDHSRYRASAESLIKRVLDGNKLYR